jgi:DNA-binding protein H-NS
MTDNHEISVPPAEFSLQVIEHLDLEALRVVAAKAADRLNKVLEETKAHELALLDELATKYGATVTWPKAKKSVRPRAGQKRKPAPVRFIDPANPEKTWTGRGRQPAWLASYVAQGRAPSEFLVS